MIIHEQVANYDPDRLMSDRDRKVLEQYKARGGNIGTTAEYARELGMSTPAMRKTLTRLRDRGFISTVLARPSLCRD